jgi:hypothetical protein
MFYTHPEAEFALPPGLAPSGERAWNWVELSLQIPYFLLSMDVEIQEVSFRRHYVFGLLRDVMALITSSRDMIKNLEMGLLTPGFMNGSDSYQLGRVAEIWGFRDSDVQVFVMADGTKFHFPPREDGLNDQEMELVISI